MKYLDRSDYIEIGIIFLIVFMILMAVTVTVIAIYYALHANLTGCVPHVAI